MMRHNLFILRDGQRIYCEAFDKAGEVYRLLDVRKRITVDEGFESVHYGTKGSNEIAYRRGRLEFNQKTSDGFLVADEVETIIMSKTLNGNLPDWIKYGYDTIREKLVGKMSIDVLLKLEIKDRQEIVKEVDHILHRIVFDREKLFDSEIDIYGQKIIIRLVD